MTLESFMQSRQDERRIQHLHMGMRVPQYTAPPPPPSGIKIKTYLLQPIVKILNMY